MYSNKRSSMLSPIPYGQALSRQGSGTMTRKRRLSRSVHRLEKEGEAALQQDQLVPYGQLEVVSDEEDMFPMTIKKRYVSMYGF